MEIVERKMVVHGPRLAFDGEVEEGLKSLSVWKTEKRKKWPTRAVHEL